MNIWDQNGFYSLSDLRSPSSKANTWISNLCANKPSMNFRIPFLPAKISKNFPINSISNIISFTCRLQTDLDKNQLICISWKGFQSFFPHHTIKAKAEFSFPIEFKFIQKQKEKIVFMDLRRKSHKIFDLY